MRVHHAELQHQLGFIDRTIWHAVRACRDDDSVPDDLKECVERLSHHSNQAQQALQRQDEHEIRQSLDRLAHASFEAQNRIHPADGMNFDVRSAVILTHIELSALRSRMD
jgi:hypothetical protein